MARTPGYPDAVRLLAGDDSQLLRTLDRIAGGALIAGAVFGAPALLGLLEARGEVARLGQDAVRAARGRREPGSRADRTRRLQAAQEVLVVTAFFETLAAADLPFRFADLELTAADRARPLAPGSLPGSPAGDAVAFFRTGPQVRERLVARYREAAGWLATFVQGLAVWDRLPQADRDRFDAAVRPLPEAAADRYVELFRRLCGDVGEAAVWADQLAHEQTLSAVAATRADVAGLGADVAGLGAALGALERRLAEAATGAAPDARRRALARASRAALDRPIAESGNGGGGPELPTLAQGYVPPAFRATPVGAEPFRGGGDRLSDEDAWSRVPVQQDLAGFLARYLTAPQASTAPLLVLGQPGSVKSVLTKVLAARLPANDFLAVRVVLRDVPVAASIQDQIEHAVRAETGERLDWPDLARSAGDAMPVVLLDGFDELLQATGVAQTDYLARVAAFQRREAEQGRPVAVVVTTRTSVANRATAPDGCVAVRLEPFDDTRVRSWTATWNATNAGWFAARAVQPLQADAVLAHPELASQPLLLLMLALYDADSGAVARSARLGTGELYERLLHGFARREVARELPGASAADLDAAAGRELRRLSVVAFAMFNRKAQWIGEGELEADLVAVLGPTAVTSRATTPDLRTPVRAAGLMLGRFFFVHRARSSAGGDERRETYEFLHATFGEFLVARLTWQVLRDVGAREAASTLDFGGEPVDDDLLHALLSHASLASRRPVVDFLGELAAGTPDAERARLAGLVVRLFGRAAGPAVGRDRFLDYRPAPLPVPARYAGYTANLVLLAVCSGGEVTGRALFPQAVDPVEDWHALALVWRAHLDVPEGWSLLVETLAVRRVRDGDRRDVVLHRRDGASLPPPTPVDLSWTYAGRAQDRLFATRHHHPDVLRHKADVLCGNVDDVALHALEPLAVAAPELVNTFVPTRLAGSLTSYAHLLLDMLLRSATAPDADLDDLYHRCARALSVGSLLLPEGALLPCLILLLDRMAARPPADTVAVNRLVRDAVVPGVLFTSPALRAAVQRWARALDEQGVPVDPFLGEVLGVMGEVQGP